MPVPSILELSGISVDNVDANLGLRVHRAAAALPQTAAEALFTISGGRILLTALVGRVTTLVETQADNTKLVANPDVGASADLCAVLDITADAVGTLYTITGTAANALVGVGPTAFGMLTTPVVLSAGTIDLDCAASNDGAAEWTLFYIPLDAGATVVAA